MKPMPVLVDFLELKHQAPVMVVNTLPPARERVLRRGTQGEEGGVFAGSAVASHQGGESTDQQDV